MGWWRVGAVGFGWCGVGIERRDVAERSEGMWRSGNVAMQSRDVAKRIRLRRDVALHGVRRDVAVRINLLRGTGGPKPGGATAGPSHHDQHPGGRKVATRMVALRVINAHCDDPPTNYTKSFLLFLIRGVSAPQIRDIKPAPIPDRLDQPASRSSPSNATSIGHYVRTRMPDRHDKHPRSNAHQHPALRPNANARPA